jgi:Flp pilus assembly protein TadD
MRRRFGPQPANARLPGTPARPNGSDRLALPQASSAVHRLFAEAVAHHQTGRLDEAIGCYRKIVARKPDFVVAYANLGAALQAQGRPDEAAACYRHVIAIRPDFPDIHSNLGILLGRQGRTEEAVACLRKALRAGPDHPDSHNNLGVALQEQGRLEDAIACYRKAIDLGPHDAAGHQNLGHALGEQGRTAEAIACYRTAIGLRPDYAAAHYNLAMVLLAQGDLEAGWVEYEWRWKTPKMTGIARQFDQPQWRGEAAEGKTLLIHDEQGFGDSLQFCRFVSLAAARGLRVVLGVPKPLARLLGGLPGVDRVVTAGDELPGFDLHCPMLSLPLAFATTLATIPADPGYLRPDPTLVESWRVRLSAMANQGQRIGLVWAGNARKHLPEAAAVDRRRSIAPDRLAPLFDIPGLHFFSLQKDGPAAPDRFALTDLMGEMTDFADTAALIANLDLVISVDTAVAHLAAGIGKPVWLLDRFDPCWRWLTGRRDSPWYPTLRLYRQRDPLVWDPVIAEVTSDLRNLLASAASAGPDLAIA